MRSQSNDDVAGECADFDYVKFANFSERGPKTQFCTIWVSVRPLRGWTGRFMICPLLALIILSQIHPISLNRIVPSCGCLPYESVHEMLGNLSDASACFWHRKCRIYRKPHFSCTFHRNLNICRDSFSVHIIVSHFLLTRICTLHIWAKRE